MPLMCDRMVVPPSAVSPNRKSRPPISRAKSEASEERNERCVKKSIYIYIYINIYLYICDFFAIILLRYTVVNQTN